MNQRDFFPYNGGQVNSPLAPPNSGNLANSIVPSPYSTDAVADAITIAPNETSSHYYGIALARSPFLERYGGWIVAGFTFIFALFLIGMNLSGHVPGQDNLLKGVSDILQFVGEFVGLIFALIITTRLWQSSTQLSQVYNLQISGDKRAMEYPIDHAEVLNARRAFIAWTLLSIAIAVYASGQAIWTSFDLRMPSAEVPYPGLYDIGFVSSYPFFLVGALLLVRSGRRATAGRARLLLDSFAVIGAAAALSWFFIFVPSISSLAQAPSPGAAILSVYFPGADLLLVALGAFLMFSPLATREQQAVFVRLCLGLFFLAVTDSVLVWLSLSFLFNTGTIQDTLWPLSMQMIGLAAIAYPQSAAYEQDRLNRERNRAGDLGLSIAVSRLSNLTLTLQTVAPFVLALGTCAILLTVVPLRYPGQVNLVVAAIIALALFVIVAVRQALTLNENNHLRMQLAGELVLSRRELQVTRREADEASREAQDKQRLEQGIIALQAIHARLASGDFSVRASTEPGPLQALAISFNLVIERLRELEVRAGRYSQLAGEVRVLQASLDHLANGEAAWSSNLPPNSKSELRPLFLSVERIQRFQLTQWKSLLSALDRVSQPVGRLRSSLGVGDYANRRSDIDNNASSSEYSLAQLEQQLQRLITQTRSLIERLEGQAAQPPLPQSEVYPTRAEQERKRFDSFSRRQDSSHLADPYQNDFADPSRLPARPNSIPPRPGRGQDR